MNEHRKIELLAPARNADIGIEAVRHGADAVYIGTSKFGARASAVNSPDDIHRLAEFAHVFGAKVYVTLNTILYDSEVREAERIARTLYDAGADALIVQDASFLTMSLPPIPLHASTQTDNRVPAKVSRLAREGFDTVVLARELSLGEIGEIHAACPEVRLEAFVHGALCVSLSGRCYASQYCFGRSANRGECAQFCRLPFNLESHDGEVIVRHKHLLSLRDMNRSLFLEQMMDAGVSSFKIEGRLKDVSYVKNVVAYYRSRIDEILLRRTEYTRASGGKCEFMFEPSPDKSFNRGFTDYFMCGRTPDMSSMNTPKSIGASVGVVEKVERNALTVSGKADFSNGDGLCFFDARGMLSGFRVNRVENGYLYPHVMPRGLQKHTKLFRNFDAAFERRLSKPTAARYVALDMVLSETDDGIRLRLSDELGRVSEITFPCVREVARVPQHDFLRKQLSQLGGTLFRARCVELRISDFCFIPPSVVSVVRRNAVAALMAKAVLPVRKKPSVCHAVPLQTSELGFESNVANSAARDFYRKCGAAEIAPAYELVPPRAAAIMTCRYCIRHALGACLREGGAGRLSRSLFLRLDDGRRFRLSFDCKHCYMKVYAPD